MGALGADYGPSDSGVRVVDRRVVNGYWRPDGEPNRHKSYGYLRTPEFSRIARDFAAGLNDRGSKCAQPRLAAADVS
jgi:hypothetical protein